ncbi:hypothetical protein BCL57_001914 [Agromyces flavus]|uniref:DUF2332 domain-containing protein n=1 Tax=Agromyces flavus TaxID=589382 RepID=A0A1H1QE46_9MICO|nr:DUF2332 domain-containing protein [Agromyces flavus]MCP2367755.1 hypothetical protein [Agromyces flavus]GGI47214.1 hypothetical protein GCM10010932_19020 [Agromyces flavus]SDS21583.1 hypothetical protein SAMN04489721_0954 [Agromyces flavus]
MRESTDAAESTAERYRVFAEVEARGTSPVYADWALGVAGDPATIDLIDELPAAKRQPNLVFTAARFHGAPSGPYPPFRDWLRAHWSDVRATASTHATQTNEAARCALHIPVLAAIDGPLALLEVGTSAGLCLFPDRYSYRYPGHPLLHPVDGPSPVVIDCATTGPVPVPDHLPEVVWRGGIDLNPLGVRDPDDLAWLDALIWPEHDDRRARLRAAAAIVAADPPRIVAGDLDAELDALVAEAPADATLVVFHTAVLAYVDAPGRAHFAEHVRRLPGHWLSVEGRTVMPGIRVREDVPNESSDVVVALDGVQLAWAQPHGRAVRWVPDP